MTAEAARQDQPGPRRRWRPAGAARGRGCVRAAPAKFRSGSRPGSAVPSAGRSAGAERPRRRPGTTHPPGLRFRTPQVPGAVSAGRQSLRPARGA